MIDMKGKRIHRWLVLEYVDVRNEAARWKCRCDCGVEKVVPGSALRGGVSRSCGGCPFKPLNYRCHPVPVVMLREQALALGLKTYFTGLPCRNGHIAKRTAVNSTCYQCVREADKRRAAKIRDTRQRYRARNPERSRLYAERSREKQRLRRMLDEQYRKETFKKSYENRKRARALANAVKQLIEPKLPPQKPRYRASPEQKAKYRESTRRWAARNPERIRALASKATRKMYMLAKVAKTILQGDHT